jgi:hypothetical protein
MSGFPWREPEGHNDPCECQGDWPAQQPNALIYQCLSRLLMRLIGALIRPDTYAVSFMKYRCRRARSRSCCR